MNLIHYKSYFTECLNLISEKEVEKLIELIINCYNNERMLFVIGNGGSAANASHFAQDMAKGTRKDIEAKKRIKAMSLTDNIAFISALGNDDGYDTVFEQQLRTYSKAGDCLIAISGSGNSSNIIKAVEWANINNIDTVGITGYNGGKLKQINNYSLHIELNDMATVESIHSFVLHYIILRIRDLFGLDKY